MIIQATNKKNFARTEKPDIDSELGTSGGSLADMLTVKKKTSSKVSIKDLRFMKDNDGTVRSLYQILRMPIMSNSWRLDPEEVPEGLQKAAKEQADHVLDNFTRPPHKGGMTTPFRLVIARTLKAVLEGYAIAEKVWTLNEQGKIVYRKIAFRDVTEVTVLRDDKGGFAGFEQSYYSKEQKKTITVQIPVEKCFLYTYNKDEDEIYGQSAFQSAYYHWDRKRRLYYLYEQSVEKGAMPPKMLEVQEGNDDTESTQRANLQAMDRFGIDSAVLVPTGYKLNPYDAGKGRIDPMPGIDHQDAQMARSVLAQFILLGSGDKTGSFALSKSHADLFMMALRGMMAEVEEHINSYLIPQLIDYNYETQYYPEFRFNDMSDDTADFIESIFLEIVKKTDLRKDFVDGLVEQVADRLDIDLTELKADDVNDTGEELPEGGAAVVAEVEEIAKTALNGAQIASLLSIVTQIVTGQMPYDTGRAVIVASFPTLSDEEIDGILEPAKTFTPTAAALSRSKKKLSHSHRRGASARHFDTEKQELAWRRDLSPAEANTNLAAIEDKIISQEKKFDAAMKPVFDDVVAQALEDIKPILEGGDITKLEDFSLTGADKYAQTITDQSLETYNAGKKITSDDLDIGIPTTPKESKEYFKQNGKSIADKQFSDLTFIIKQKVTSEFHKGQLSRGHEFATPEEIAALLGEDFEQFYQKTISLTGVIAVAQAINRSRDDVFETAKEDIEVYQYSAILDDVTCELCEAMDGTVVEHEEYKASPYQPPEHGFCRCIWIAIKKDQTDIPETTGIPDIPEEVVAKNQAL